MPLYPLDARAFGARTSPPASVLSLPTMPPLGEPCVYVSILKEFSKSHSSSSTAKISVQLMCLGEGKKVRPRDSIEILSVDKDV